MVTFISQTSILLLLLLYATTFQKIMSNNLGKVRCNEKDRRTLLIFKQGVLDPSNQLATWSSEKDCCAWKGVQCDNTTSRVTKLDLSLQSLEGEINLSLLELEFLNHLNLSNNNFNAISIPPIHNDVISHSKLHYLDLSSNYHLSMDNLRWLSQLSSLKYLDLSSINLPKETNWLQLLAMLPSLSELRLSDCELNNTAPSLEHVNFTSLVTLDLSGNYFSSKSLYWLFNLSSDISHLDLGGIDLSGNFDLQWLSRLSSLKYLDLSGIDLHNETNWLLAMPPSLSNLYLSDCQLTNTSPSLEHVNFTSLVTLDLSGNYFNSELPHELFNLSNDISYLDLSRSSLRGEIPSSLFEHQNLKHLDLSQNMFSGSIPSTLGNLTSLVTLSIDSNSFSGSIPSTLGNLTSLVSLRIGSNSFSGAISETHFSRLRDLEELDMSNSSFAFHFNPEWIPLFQLESLCLDNTNQGPIFPSWIYTQKSLVYLSVSSSGISFVDKDRFKSLITGNYFMLDMSNNSISEDISNVMLNSTFIKLHHNNFTVRLPHLSPMVYYLDLSCNSFTGTIPRGWKNLKDLNYLNLWGNKLFGEVPVELSNSTLLQVMNLGENEFSGTIPINMSQNLDVVILRSNQFEGSIPPQLFNLSFLFHLDLAHNKLSGSIPQVVYNTTEMIMDNYSHAVVDDDIINLFTKNQEYEYNLRAPRRTIDLSANKLSGEIPSELFGLIQVQTLNLSYNHLTGTIPKTIGGMKNLESLDLSNNKLFGEIPQNMATLSFLGVLNLSCNNFTGQIPLGTQLQSFNASSYIGNAELCGAPLTKCSTEEKDPVNAMQHAGKEDGDSEKEALYLGMGVGFAVGFWGFCGSLLLFRKWRHMYYRFLDRVSDKLYVTYMVKFNTFLNREGPAS